MSEDDLMALADQFKAASGKPFHWSSCATSRAPAEMPGPCDCASPWLPMHSAPRDGSAILVAGGTFQDDDDWPGSNYSFGGVAIVHFYNDAWQGEAAHAHDEYRWHKPEYWIALPAPPAIADQSPEGESAAGNADAPPTGQVRPDHGR